MLYRFSFVPLYPNLKQVLVKAACDQGHYSLVKTQEHKQIMKANTPCSKAISKDNQTLVSEGQRFELGFFSSTNSNNRYLAIWYKNISPLTVVWIANRNTPVTNSSGVFTIDDNGKLILLNQDQSVIWSSNESKQGNPSANKPIAKLLNSGNLVVTEESDNDDDTGNYRWQSFDHATDTLLPGMMLGWDLNTGLNNSLVSWKSAEDPSIGDHSFVIGPDGCPEAYILREQIPIYRSGPWNGIQFSGVPEMNTNGGFKFNFVFNQKQQKYYSFEVTDESIISRTQLHGEYILIMMGGLSYILHDGEADTPRLSFINNRNELVIGGGRSHKTWWNEEEQDASGWSSKEDAATVEQKWRQWVWRLWLGRNEFLEKAEERTRALGRLCLFPVYKTYKIVVDPILVLTEIMPLIRHF
ncbi:hypothetical protein IFM89_000584 [Coptis chinensis]|uniref:Bulb-type lectin domain-containing protein n=1 Tax=Coptis chinensis TaxID=261450 RepID=A0A835LQ53_9MAGN|nr:hypothetical protein IFM89_000584 [Coptis chinensis]